MEIDEIIGRITFFRNRAKLTGRELSRSIGKSSGYIGNLERKRDGFAPSLETLMEIIKVCNISPCIFFADSRDIEIIKILGNYSPVQKEILLKKLKEK